MTTGFSKQIAALIVAAGAALLALGGGQAQAQMMMQKYDLPTLTEKADTIFVASCTKRTTSFRDGNIITRYTLKPSEVWKGTAKLDSAGEATLDQIGGQIDGPLSVGQLDTTSVVLSEGQQVLLFTQSVAPTAAPTAAGTPSANAPAPATISRVVGGPLGAYSVIQDPETGQKLVAPGTALGRLGQDKLDKTLAARKLALANQPSSKNEAPNSAPQKAGEAPAKAAAAPADEIKPFDELATIRDRVKQLMNPSSSK